MRLLIVFYLLFTSTAFAQVCLSNIPESAAEASFIDHEDGTVTHTKTGLMWMRCSLGQTWDQADKVCTGDAQPLTWQQALNTAYDYQYVSKSDWRLPNIKELSSILERRCARPSINATVFPNTQSDDYWTSTPSAIDPLRSWVVAFFTGSNGLKDKTLFPYVRLVRTAG